MHFFQIWSFENYTSKIRPHLSHNFLFSFSLSPSNYLLSLFLPSFSCSPSFFLSLLLFLHWSILSKLLIQGSSWWWSSFFHGLFPSGWRFLSPLLLCLPLHLHGGKSPLKDLIEDKKSSLHRSPTSKVPSHSLRKPKLKGHRPKSSQSILSHPLRNVPNRQSPNKHRSTMLGQFKHFKPFKKWVWLNSQK